LATSQINFFFRYAHPQTRDHVRYYFWIYLNVMRSPPPVSPSFGEVINWHSSFSANLGCSIITTNKKLTGQITWVWLVLGMDDMTKLFWDRA